MVPTAIQTAVRRVHARWEFDINEIAPENVLISFISVLLLSPFRGV